MKTVKLQLIPRTIEAVQLTEDNLDEVRAWVQSKLPFHRVHTVKDIKVLYLPSDGPYIDVLEPGDWVFYDPQDNLFKGAEDSAVQSFYVEVPDDADRQI